MQNDLSGEQCVLCNAAAAVRVTGTSFCASCGLQQYSDGTLAAQAHAPANNRSHRAALIGLFSSGFLLKMLLGAVALATVGGVTASLQTDPVVASAGPPPTVVTRAPVTSVVEATVESNTDDSSELIAAANEQAAAAHEYVDAIQAWANCVSEAASAHSGGPFDPGAVCDDRPTPADFGIPGHDEDGPGESENAPGREEDGPGKSEDAPGRVDDADKDDTDGDADADADADADKDDADKDDTDKDDRDDGDRDDGDDQGDDDQGDDDQGDDDQGDDEQ